MRWQIREVKIRCRWICIFDLRGQIRDVEIGCSWKCTFNLRWQIREVKMGAGGNALLTFIKKAWNQGAVYIHIPGVNH